MSCLKWKRLVWSETFPVEGEIGMNGYMENIRYKLLSLQEVGQGVAFYTGTAGVSCRKKSKELKNYYTHLATRAASVFYRVCLQFRTKISPGRRTVVEATRSNVSRHRGFLSPVLGKMSVSLRCWTRSVLGETSTYKAMSRVWAMRRKVRFPEKPSWNTSMRPRSTYKSSLLHPVLQNASISDTLCSSRFRFRIRPTIQVIPADSSRNSLNPRKVFLQIFLCREVFYTLLDFHRNKNWAQQLQCR